MTCPEDRCSARFLGGVEVDRLHLPRRGISPIVGGNAVFSIHEPVGPLPHRQIPDRSPFGSTLCDDVDHTMSRFSAVEGSGSRPLDDLNALNIIRVEIIDTGDDARAESLDRMTRRLGIVYANTIYIEERLVGEGEAARPPDPYLGARACRTWCAGEELSGWPRIVRVQPGGDRRHVYRCRGTYPGYYVSDRPPLSPTRRTGHHWLIKGDRRRGQDDTTVGRPHVHTLPD